MQHDLTKWTSAELVACFAADEVHGFAAADFSHVAFNRTTREGRAVFDVAVNCEGEILKCEVFVFFRDGKLIADF